jgi:putative addiction module component (TIGR02574 family)
MNPKTEMLYGQILALPADERSALTVALLNHEGDAASHETPEAVAQAWESELTARVERLDSGAVQTSPWHEVRARLLPK